MAFPTVTYTHSRGSTVVANELNTNMDNLISGLTLGDKDATVKTVYAQTMNVSNQSVVNALNFGENELNTYVTGVFTAILSTDTATTSVVFDYSVIGNMVSLRIGLWRTSLAAATATMKTVYSLPTAVRPPKSVIFSYQAIDNNLKIQYGAYGIVGSDGIVSFYLNQTNGNWSAANKNNGSLTNATITYNRS
jgi:hypothetical protein